MAVFEAVAESVADERSIGIDPVPPKLRRLRAVDTAVLWGDLAVGILVLAAGALLVAPDGLGMGFGPALLAMAIGSVAGSLLLALVAVVGHDHGVPTMVLLRPVLGRYGSYGASIVNVVQLVGWTAFEFWAIGLFAARASEELFGVRAFGVWLVFAAVACTAMALLGPFAVVRHWMEKASVWIVLGACGFLTVYLLATADFGELFSGGTNGAFGSGVDLVVALPVSWLPLVADYNRFSIGARQNFSGTFAGYTLGNFWFYALGALLVLSGGLVDSSPEGIAVGILGISAGSVVAVTMLVALLAGETDEAWADMYSAAVSTQNVLRRLPQPVVILAVSAIATGIAAVVTVGSYETFLFLLGSVFVPLFAVLLADCAAGGGRLAEPGSASEPAARPGMIGAWVAGFAAYQWMVPTGPSWWVRWFTDTVPGAGDHSWLGASLPSFALTFVVAFLAARPSRRPVAAG